MRRTAVCEVVDGSAGPRRPPGVVGCRGLRLSGRGPRRGLELPDGCVTVLLLFDGEVRVAPVTERRAAVSARRVLVSGPSTTAYVGERSAELHGVEMLLQPWLAHSVFGVPMSGLTGIRADAGADRRLTALAGELAAQAGWRERFAVLDETLGAWSAAGPAPAPQVVAAWSDLVAGEGLVSVGDLAAGVGWGRRRLQSGFREQIGLSPKAAARVLRLHKAVRLLSRRAGFSQVATACGFCDQAHFSRDFKQLTGVTPGAYLAGGIRTFSGRCAFLQYGGTGG